MYLRTEKHQFHAGKSNYATKELGQCVNRAVSICIALAIRQTDFLVSLTVDDIRDLTPKFWDFQFDCKSSTRNTDRKV